MAGVKGRSGGPRANAGGARPGAGRKPKEPAASTHEDPLEYLRAVWMGHVDANMAQVSAAKAALPFVHQKLGETGKKEQKADAAKDAVKGRFAPKAAPRLVHSK